MEFAEAIGRLPTRMHSRIADDPSGCWLWTGHCGRAGYGHLNYRGHLNYLAHRLVWLLLVGELPENLHHRCHVKACVNPAHLEPMTRADHTSHHNSLSVACKHGHAYTPENTYYRLDGRGRQCRACKAVRQRAVYRADPQRWTAAGSERRRQRKAEQRAELAKAAGWAPDAQG